MSLPPIISAGIIADPEDGKSPMKVYFTDGSMGYDAIEQTGSAANTIVTSGSETDYIKQR